MEQLGMILNVARELFFDTDDDDEISVVEKVQDYAEEIVPNFSSNNFRMHFRVKPDTFEDLLQKLHSVNDNEIHRGSQPIPLEKQLMITVWCLANMESFRSVSERFNISKSTCWDVLYRTCRNLLKVNYRYKIISWPNRDRAVDIMRHFQQINGFPRIIGSIDGCHIKILKPNRHPNSYLNRKNYHSVLLQGVCDHQKLFLDVYAGQPGSLHDMRLFRKSDLFQRIHNLTAQFPEDSHLIGDLAYKLSVHLMVGFKNRGNLSDREKKFNQKLSQCRVVIENAYAYLKGRFRRLKYLETIRLDLISLLIVSGCIMHNICILQGDLPEDLVDDVELIQIRNENEIDEIENDADEEAIIKKIDIMNGLRMVHNL